MTATGAIDLFHTLRELTPFDVEGGRKRRVGGSLDGAYVLLDRLRPEQPVYSYGIGGSLDFDAELAGDGHAIWMFDPYVAALPREHAKFTWLREGLAGVAAPGEGLFTFEDHLTRHGHDGRDDLLLKVDIEGAEWGFLGAVAPALLRRCEQIVLELHDLHRLAEPDWNRMVRTALRKLNRDFTLFHVHANNWAPLAPVNGFVVPDVLEVSYVRSDLVRPLPSRSWYPTVHDAPNKPDTPEYLLWFFPFVPDTDPPGLQDAQREQAAQRVQAQAGLWQVRAELAQRQAELAWNQGALVKAWAELAELRAVAPAAAAPAAMPLAPPAPVALPDLPPAEAGALQEGGEPALPAEPRPEAAVPPTVPDEPALPSVCHGPDAGPMPPIQVPGEPR